MKKLNYLWMLGLLMFAAVSFSACSSDDDEPGSNSDLVGLWEVIADKGWEKVDGKIDAQWDQEGDEIGDKYQFEFKEDGTFFAYSNDGFDEISGKATWKYKNGKIFLHSSQYNIEVEFATVKELTSSRLVLENYQTDNEDGEVWESWSLATFKKINK